MRPRSAAVPGRSDVRTREDLDMTKPSSRSTLLRPRTGALRTIRNTAARLIVSLTVLLAAHTAQAERFLTLEEAQKLCFPEATTFEAQTLRFTAEQTKGIAAKCGLAVRNQGNRLWLARTGSNVSGVLFLDHVIGKHELIDYAVALTPDGKVRQIEILEYRENYGGEIRRPQWREQFRGKDATARLKLTDDVSNISGATISCRHVTEGIKRVLATFEVVVRPRLSAIAGDGVPNPAPPAAPARP
ncbi:hypothetical protein LBMAG56_08410 [Verrucomicrobiota bacterium]|nr:hypothetical protein LBMAG56_08410 [Verrucomicrobiota bacterium]